MSKALGDSALKALKAWVKSYVGTAVQGGGIIRLSCRSDIYEHEPNESC